MITIQWLRNKLIPFWFIWFYDDKENLYYLTISFGCLFSLLSCGICEDEHI